MIKSFVLAALLALCVLTACAAGPDYDTIRARAERGDTRAQAVLGEMYANGTGVSRDYAEAAKWWDRSGSAKAQYNIGVLYEQGKGFRQNFAEAARRYRIAADSGLAAAQYNLGVLYDHGKGVKQSDAAAAEWYRRAAQQGHKDAQFNLGALYASGRGVKRSESEAYFWLSLVARAGDRDATRLREQIGESLSPAQRTALDRRAQLASRGLKKGPLDPDLPLP